MNLRPAIRTPSSTIPGDHDDSHNTLIDRKKLGEVDDRDRGFTPNGKLFLTRRQALGWLKTYEPKIYDKVIREKMVQDEGLHSGFYAEAKGIKQKEEKVDLSRLKVLVADKGLYTYLAQKLGEQYGKVWYCMPESDPYPKSPKSQIGAGLEEIERVRNFHKYVDKADLICFFDCYNGWEQYWLRKQGYLVFGGGRAEKLELDKWWFLEQLEKAGLPVPKTKRIKGLDPLEEFLTGKGEKWLKTSYHRGDFETYHFTGDMNAHKEWSTDLRARIGERRAKNIEVLVQNPIESVCEAGYDGFQVDEQYTPDCLIGYEIKDKGLVAKVFDHVPEILKNVNDAMAPIEGALGYRGHASTEVRIKESGKAYYIDPTKRAPSPPSELMCEIFENYPSAVYDISRGRVPKLVHKAKYGAELILTSDWHDKHELSVKVPKEIRQHVKIKNQMGADGQFFCIPNDNSGFWGAAVAWADTMQGAVDQVLEIVKQIEATDMDAHEGIFDEATEIVEKGAKFGLGF